MRRFAYLRCLLFLALLTPKALYAQVLSKEVGYSTFPSHPSGLIEVKGTILFAADDGVHGKELWRSDGTEEGTTLVKDIDRGSGSSLDRYFFAVESEDILYFNAFDEVHGYELWRSDGTEEGTTLVKDICPGICSSSPKRFIEWEGYIYFDADDGAQGARSSSLV